MTPLAVVAAVAAVVLAVTGYDLTTIVAVTGAGVTFALAGRQR